MEQKDLRKKHQETKQEVLEILREITKHIEDEEYEKVWNYLEFSAAGDGYGDENRYIDFGGKDIGAVVSELFYCKKEEERLRKVELTKLFKKVKKEHPDWKNKKIRKYCKEICKEEGEKKND